ncbi:MAG: flagellar biosynthetic protein FliR [Phycisphaerae bacterium]|nr:flagellar biosynthetic protein FliR [Phycisphaerae bacterium]
MDFLTGIVNIFEQGPVFVLVLFRIGGLLTSAPMFSSVSIPVNIKIFIALILAMIIFPVVPTVTWAPDSYLVLAIAIGSEMLIGIAMGFVISLIMLGVQLGAEIMSQQMGLSMSQLIDPSSNAQTTVISQFFLLLVTVIFLISNGHLVLIQALRNTFDVVPLMAGFHSQAVVDTMIATITTAFQLGICIAGPGLVAIFLATLALGFISRTMPQLNILAAGFPIRIGLSFVILLVTLTAVVGLFDNYMTLALQSIGNMFLTDRV